MLGMSRGRVNAGHCMGIGSRSTLSRRVTNLQPVFLRHWWDDTVQAQVLDKLSVVVSDVPDCNDRDAQFSVRSGVTTFDTVERVVRRERSEDTVGVVEGILQILDQLGFGFRRIVPTLFARYDPDCLQTGTESRVRIVPFRLDFCQNIAKHVVSIA
jgi:hypothetical protein